MFAYFIPLIECYLHYEQYITYFRRCSDQSSNIFMGCSKESHIPPIFTIKKLGLASQSALRRFSDLLMSLSLCLSLSQGGPFASVPVLLFMSFYIPVTVPVPISLLIPVCVPLLLFLPLCPCSAVPSMFLQCSCPVPICFPVHLPLYMHLSLILYLYLSYIPLSVPLSISIFHPSVSVHVLLLLSKSLSLSLCTCVQHLRGLHHRYYIPTPGLETGLINPVPPGQSALHGPGAHVQCV